MLCESCDLLKVEWDFEYAAKMDFQCGKCELLGLNVLRVIGSDVAPVSSNVFQKNTGTFQKNKKIPGKKSSVPEPEPPK